MSVTFKAPKSLRHAAHSKLHLTGILLAGTALALVARPGHALAAPGGQHYSVSINPTTVVEALREIERRTGASVVYSPDQIRDVRTEGVTGDLTVDEALARLLQGTGLSVKTNNKGSYVVVGERAASKIQIEAPAGGFNITRIAAANTEQVSASAQTAQAAPAIEEIVVTGSRVGVTDFTSPTPVTAVTAEDLQQSQPLISDALNELPSLKATNGPQQTQFGTGGGGQAYLNLRALGAARTLVLLDGKRFVPSSGGNSPDTSLFPDPLISRVEVVTGGASAAYGSDAVSGVVNYILNKKFTGVRAEAEYGISQLGDDDAQRVTLTAGSGFANDRGHVEGSFNFFYSKGLQNTERDFANIGATLVTNANLTPYANVITTNAHLNNIALGGLVTSGALKGLTFDQGGAPTQFVYGSALGTNAAYTLGGNGPYSLLGPVSGLNSPINRKIGFARVSYDLTDNINTYADVMFGAVNTHYVNGQNYATGGGQTITIKNDNAFLPASIAAAMAANKLTSIALSEIITGPANDPNTQNDTWRGTLGVDFKLSDKWSGDFSFEHGHTASDLSLTHMLNQLKFYPATDAVRNSNGQIVCRSTLTAPNDGCVPYNAVGWGVASQAALDYVEGTYMASLRTTEDSLAFNIRGEPIDLWAGPLSMAFGGEYRRETFVNFSDAVAQTFNPYTGASGGWRGGNQQPTAGVTSNSVKEGYVETLIPLIKDMKVAQSLDFDGAVRVTDYENSGSVTTWKAGLNWAVWDEMRLRGTRSRDIRAPTLQELFGGGGQSSGTASDPLKGVTGTVKGIGISNPALKPEIANTLTYGAVYRPGWLPGFDFSVDVFDIKIAGAITSLSVQNVLDQCAAGSTPLCSFAVRDAAGTLVYVNTTSFNYARAHTKGIDFEGSYRTPLALGPLDGNVTFRGLWSYVSELSTQSPGAASVDRAGDVGAGHGGVPHWRGLMQMNYDQGPYGWFLAARYIQGGRFDNTLTAANAINRPFVPAMVYWNTRVSYKFTGFGGDAQVYVNVNNLMDAHPPLDPTSGSFSQYSNYQLYDAIGRFFRVGISMKY